MKKRNIKNKNKDNHFWISISDLMTSILFIFILILSYTILEYYKKQQIAQQKIEIFSKNLNARTELLKRIYNDLYRKGINIEIDEDSGTMRIVKEKLFDTSKADIREDKKWIIKEVANEIKYLFNIPKYKNAINTIFIEGHTDNQHLNIVKCGIHWTNMELSASRAINTYLYMNTVTNGWVKNIKNSNNQALFSYSGYADTRPIKNVSNDSIDGRERNRRIQFFFAINPPILND